MKATHTDYLHPRHLRVETGQSYPAGVVAGHFTRTALCVAPSSSDYARLNKPGLPKWKGGQIVDGVVTDIWEGGSHERDL